MTETIETFVAQLKTQGVDAGKAEAQALLADATTQAESIVAKAQTRAEKTLADASAQAESILQRAQTELQLASRDIVATLRATLDRALTALLGEATTVALGDGEFIKTLLAEMLSAYATADAAGESNIEINLSTELQSGLSAWLAQQCATARVRTELAQAGFEYEINGAKVEVTTPAVVELLSTMVSAALRELLTQTD